LKHVNGDEDEEDFYLYESHAILKYICDINKLPDHWYPTEHADPALSKEESEKRVKMRASIDMYLNWHHSGTRCGATHYFYKKFLNVIDDEDDPEKINAAKESLNKSYK